MKDILVASKFWQLWVKLIDTSLCIIYIDISFQLLWVNTKSMIAESHGKYMLSFIRNSQLFLNWLPFCISASKEWELLLLRILICLLVLSVLIFLISLWWYLILIYLLRILLRSLGLKKIRSFVFLFSLGFFKCFGKRVLSDMSLGLLCHIFIFSITIWENVLSGKVVESKY